MHSLVSPLSRLVPVDRSELLSRDPARAEGVLLNAPEPLREVHAEVIRHPSICKERAKARGVVYTEQAPGEVAVLRQQRARVDDLVPLIKLVNLNKRVHLSHDLLNLLEGLYVLFREVRATPQQVRRQPEDRWSEWCPYGRESGGLRVGWSYAHPDLGLGWGASRGWANGVAQGSSSSSGSSGISGIT